MRHVIEQSELGSETIIFTTTEDLPDFSQQDIVAVFVGLGVLDLEAAVVLSRISVKTTEAPVIAIAEGDFRTKTRALEAGCTEFLFDHELMPDKINEALALAAARQKATPLVPRQTTEYKRHFDDGPVPMWVIDMETLHFLEVNRACLDKYGYTREELLSMRLSDIRPEEDVPLLLTDFHNNLTAYLDAGYWRHRKKNGEVFWVHVYSHSTVFNGRNARISSVVDVNEKVKTENINKQLTIELQSQKHKLDNILLSVRDAIWSRNADTLDLIYANEAFFNLFGGASNRVDATNSSFFGQIHPDDLRTVMESMAIAREVGFSEVEYRYLMTDGSLKMLSARISYKKGGHGAPDTVNGITTDVTEARAMENRIRQSEQNLLATINNTKDLIWSVNTNLEIIFCNKPYQDFIYSLTGIIPKPGDYVLGEWGSEAFVESRRRDYERALMGESFTTVVEETYDGDLLCKEFSNNPIKDDDGTIRGVNCIARDVSEQKRQFMRIQEQNEQLKEIAWIQSHNVRGPVASILGLAELFVIDAEEDEHNSEILANLKIATNNLDDIIKEVVEKTKMLKRK